MNIVYVISYGEDVVAKGMGRVCSCETVTMVCASRERAFEYLRHATANRNLSFDWPDGKKIYVTHREYVVCRPHAVSE